MATHTGVEGVVKLGSNAVAEVRDWSFTVTANMVEDSNQNDTTSTFIAGRSSWTANINCMWDETDTNGQEALTIGASVTLNLYPEGATTGDKYYTGTALVQSFGVTVPDGNGMVTRTVSLQGSGALTLSTAA